MLLEEVILSITPNGELNAVLIVPDGQEYHLFVNTNGNGNERYTLVERPISLGSIVLRNKGWVYEGKQLPKEIQKQVAHYIINYDGKGKNILLN